MDLYKLKQQNDGFVTEGEIRRETDEEREEQAIRAFLIERLREDAEELVDRHQIKEDLCRYYNADIDDVLDQVYQK